jgi:tRNA pseudouridine13 synthase
MATVSELPRPCGAAVLQARMRCVAEDFVVDEQLGFEPDGSGEHLFLRVRKRGANTAFVARELARWAGIDERSVGYAGMKDRHAVTTQTFSLHLPGRESPPQWPEHAEFSVIAAQRHGRKLPRGALAGNAFSLLLRDVVGDAAAIEQRWAQIAEHGFANYFGEQRFGRDGGNLDAAARMFAGQRVRREQRGLLLSAARSALFNAVLAARIDDGTWHCGAEGEVWMLDGSHSVFGPQEHDDSLRERARSGDIHPTGPLWGAGSLRSGGRVRTIEEAALQPFEAICHGLAGTGLRQERRALRVRPAGMALHWEDAGASLRLTFFLPAGAYATALLHALGTVIDASTPAAARTPADGGEATSAGD